MSEILFTPGPLSTTLEVKKEMLRDIGSRDLDFIKIIKNIRNKLVSLACHSSNESKLYTSILIQGSGTYGVEATLNSLVPKDYTNNKLLILSNGSYGDRLEQISNKSNINYNTLRFDNKDIINIDIVKDYILENKNVKYLAMVHHETSTGQINDLDTIGQICRENNIIFIVDSMSAFGAIDIDVYKSNIDFLISSANKCLEGVPGFSFIICKKNLIKQCINSSSLCLDILDQWNTFEKTGQFRFTPPTHTILAFDYALKEYQLHGGLKGRIEKYKNNYTFLKKEMIKLGFKCYLDDNKQGYFITSFLYLDDNFLFDNFYNHLKKHKLVIYPGKKLSQNTFRIGNIGNITKDDITRLIDQIRIFIKNN